MNTTVTEPVGAPLVGRAAQTRAYAQRWWILLILSLSLVIIVVDNTNVNVALPVLQRKLSASASDLQWIVDSYLVVFAGLLLVMGTLGDRFGRKRALQIGLLLFGLSSIAAAAAQSSTQLIGVRVAMGIGGALIMPATLAILVYVFPESERSKALGVWTGVAALGIPLGPIIGGWLIDQFWWGAIFLLNVPVVIVALAGSLILVPESRHPLAPAVDLLGAALSAGTLASLVYGLVEAPIRGWLDSVVLGAFGGALVLCILFVLWELHLEQPLLDVRLFRHPRFSAGTTAIAVATLALTGLTFLLTQYLQVVRHFSPLGAGVRMLPLSLGFMVGAGMSHRLLVKLGTRWVVTGALILIAGSLMALSYLAVDAAYWVLGVGLGCFGIGLGGAIVPSTDAVMAAVPLANAGVGSAVNDAARQVGAALGVAVLVFLALGGVSRWMVPPLAAAIERPMQPFGHAAADLARDNTVRAPGRTATTAAALTVGVALIVVATVLAQGLSQTTGNSIRRQVTAAYVVTPQQDVLPPEVQRALNAAGLASASVRAGTVHSFDNNEVITAVNPAEIARFYRFQWIDGSSRSALAALDNAGVLIASDFATAHHLKPGMQLTAQTTAGATLRLVVRGVYAAPTIAPLLGAMTVTTDLFDRSFTTPGDRAVYVDGTGGAQSRAAIEAVLKPFPTAQLRSLDQFITLSQAPVAEVLNLFYVLLALSVIISLFGLVNTLALTVTERTREIGVLRAIGMTRAQVALMICVESEIIALIGATIGIAVGLVLAAVAAQALSTWAVGYSIPWLTLAVLVVVALLASAVAGILPARRAARLDPLTALSYE